MSIYLFKTEEFYGGETKLFTNKVEAETYLVEFFKRTNDKIDAVIEEHHPFPTKVVFEGVHQVCAYQIGLDVYGDKVIVSYDGRFDGLDRIYVNDIQESKK